MYELKRRPALSSSSLRADWSIINKSIFKLLSALCFASADNLVQLLPMTKQLQRRCSFLSV